MPHAPITRPEDAKVQLNLSITWDYRERLRKAAKRRGETVTAFVRATLEKEVPSV